MGPDTFIATSRLATQIILNFLIIRMKQWRAINRLPADVQTEVMQYNIGEDHTIFSWHVNHICYYEVKTNW